MILTDIYIPAIDGNYDFMLDENAQLTQLIAEISEMISKKVNEAKLEQIGEFVVYSMDTGSMLDLRISLYENGIRDGSRLLLV